MPGATYNFEIASNEGFDRTFTYQAADGTPVDLTGYAAALKLKASPAAAAAVSLSSGAGITLGGVAGTIRIVITAVQAASLDVGEVYDYDLLLTPPAGQPFQLLAGTCTAVQGMS